MSRATPLAELQASFGLLTVLPVGAAPPPRRGALPAAPVVGLALGGVAAGLLLGARWAYPGAAGAFLAAVLALVALAGLTRALHLDGLADTADGFARFGGAGPSLDAMRRGDVGPAGVSVLVLVLAADVAALGRDALAGRGAVAVLTAVFCGRLAMLHAGVATPPARPDGLGASVARSVPRWWAMLATVAALAGAASPVLLGAPVLAGRLAGGLVAGLLAGRLVTRAAVARFGGITGDVLGAVCELAAAVTLLVTALG